MQPAKQPNRAVKPIATPNLSPPNLNSESRSESRMPTPDGALPPAECSRVARGIPWCKWCHHRR